MEGTKNGSAIPRREAHALIDIFPFGVILLSGTSRVLAANRAAERILCRADGLSRDGRRLLAGSEEETRALHHLVAETAREGERGDGRVAQRVSRPSGRRPLQVVVARLGQESAEEADSRKPPPVALFVTDPDEAIEIPAERLRQLYGLTASEARIASRLAAGLRPEDVAGELGVQTNTIRMHLKRIFAKTRTHRQSELVGLLVRGAVRLATS